jgi:hypothetical protein
MRLRTLCLGSLHLLLCALLCTPGFSQTVPKLHQVLLGVQDHVKEFEHSLPDFICDETITSRELISGTLQHETVIESVFMGTQHHDENGRPFIESREIKTIDGRPAAQGQQLAGPFFFSGGFSSILVEIFAPENIQYFNYKLMGTEKVEDRTALVVRFDTKNGQKKLLYREIFGRQAVLKGRGKAWIDSESMNVIRLELQYMDPPFPEGVLAVSVDYAEVVINGKKFWMPRMVKAEQTVPNPKMPVSGQYFAQYSNYHQFNVSVHIKYN